MGSVLKSSANWGYYREKGGKALLQILELFGGIGSPRIALRNMGVPTKSIDYVEIDQKAVDSYNAIFANDLENRVQSVVNWNLKPDILIHGSPCQDISIAGHQKGADEGSETRSSLMWETLRIIRDMGMWRPRVVIWENVKAVTEKRMRKISTDTWMKWKSWDIPTPLNYWMQEISEYLKQGKEFSQFRC